MFAQVRELLYWKTEHLDAQGCQDALLADPERGLFAIADGAGSTLFPGIWARILVEHFITLPLLSGDPFEVEWWLQSAQDIYNNCVPDLRASRHYTILQKARRLSSASTLTTLRITTIQADKADAEILACGDSCILIAPKNEQHIYSFPLQHAHEFERDPHCLPASRQLFLRHFDRCESLAWAFYAGDQIVLVTDAVAHWFAHFSQTSTRREAFESLTACQTDKDWQAFIDRCRCKDQMLDDDASALIVTFLDEPTQTSKPLGITNTHTPEIVAERRLALRQAKRDDRLDLVAMYYGDGQDFLDVPIGLNITHVQAVADALSELVHALGSMLNAPDLPHKIAPLWQKHQLLLQNESCAANLRATLAKNGVFQLPSRRSRITRDLQISSLPQPEDKEKRE